MLPPHPGEPLARLRELRFTTTTVPGQHLLQLHRCPVKHLSSRLRVGRAYREGEATHQRVEPSNCRHRLGKPRIPGHGNAQRTVGSLLRPDWLFARRRDLLRFAERRSRRRRTRGVFDPVPVADGTDDATGASPSARHGISTARNTPGPSCPRTWLSTTDARYRPRGLGRRRHVGPRRPDLFVMWRRVTSPVDPIGGQRVGQRRGSRTSGGSRCRCISDRRRRAPRTCRARSGPRLRGRERGRLGRRGAFR